MQINLSDAAFDHLAHLARERHYVSDKPNSRRIHGLHLYIAALGEYATLIDNRPDYVKAMDHDLLLANRLPIWSPEYRRYRRCILVTPLTLYQCNIKALTLGITNHRRGDSIEKTYSVLSAMLEAIGVEWLIPQNVPINPNHIAPQFRQKKRASV